MATEKRWSRLVSLLTRGESLWSLGKLIGGTAAWAVVVGVVSQIWPTVANGAIYATVAAVLMLGLLLLVRAHRDMRAAGIRSNVGVDGYAGSSDDQAEGNDRPRVAELERRIEELTESADKLVEERERWMGLARQGSIAEQRWERERAELEQHIQELTDELEQLRSRDDPPETTLTEEGVRRLSELMATGEKAIGMATTLFDKMLQPGNVSATDDCGRLCYQWLVGYMRRNERDPCSHHSHKWHNLFAGEKPTPAAAQYRFQVLYCAYQRLRVCVHKLSCLVGREKFNQNGLARMWHEEDRAFHDELDKVLRRQDMQNLRAQIRYFHNAELSHAVFELTDDGKVTSA